MTEQASDGNSREAKPLAAVMAAVQAFLDEEEHTSSSSDTGSLGAWKSAAWPVMRGSGLVRTLSWKHTG